MVATTEKAGGSRTYTATRPATTCEGLPVLLTCQQAAELAGVSRRHIRNLLTSGAIRGTRLGRAWRIPRDAFMQAIGLGV